MVSLKKASILVVDDSSTIRSLVTCMLRSLGATHVDFAASGEEALSKLHLADYT